MADLSWNRYGKSRIRLVKVRRSRDPHEIVDLTIAIGLMNAFNRMAIGFRRPPEAAVAAAAAAA